VECIFTDFNDDKLIFRIRMILESKKRRAKTEEKTTVQTDEIFILKTFQDSLLNRIILRGIKNINKVMPRKIQNTVVLEDGKYIKKDIWVLDTTGTNLLSTLGLDSIDSTRTYSNHIREVYHVLGIEAARQIIYNEIAETMEYSESFINYHHLSLLCDRIMMTEEMVPIFRSGLLNDNVGPVAKATFEVHSEVLINAARHAEFDHMRGVSASVMCGQYGNYGTGAFQLIVDHQMLSNNIVELKPQVATTTREDDYLKLASSSSSNISKGIFLAIFYIS
jgi:DNA-directed RNA polymerase II subunit RPB1